MLRSTHMLVPIVFMPGLCLVKGDVSPVRSGSVLITFLRNCHVVDLSCLLRTLLFPERCLFLVRNHLLFCCLKQRKIPSKNCHCFFYHSCPRVLLVALCVPLFTEHCLSLLYCVVVSLRDCALSACFLPSELDLEGIRAV